MAVASLTDCRLQVQLVDSADALDLLRAEWSALEQGHVFCSWQWLDTWWQHYQTSDMQLFTVALRDATGELVGLAPWYLSQAPRQGRVLRFLGSGEVCSDYLTVLARPEVERQVGIALADWLSSEAAHWDLIELTGLADDSTVMNEFRAQLQARGYLVHEQPDCSCWRLEFPPSWDAYLARLSNSRRTQTRRLLRQNFDSGRVVLRQVETPAELEQGLQILIDLHQKRRESLSQPGCFASTQFTSFQLDVAAQMLATGRLRLLWLELAGQPIAVEYDFVSEDTVYYYQGGFDPAIADERPGSLMFAASLKLAIEQGYRWFDFLRGDEPYKTSWRAERTGLRQMRVVAQRPSAHARHAAWRTRETIKRWARQGLTWFKSGSSSDGQRRASNRKEIA